MSPLPTAKLLMIGINSPNPSHPPPSITYVVKVGWPARVSRSVGGVPARLNALTRRHCSTERVSTEPNRAIRHRRKPGQGAGKEDPESEAVGSSPKSQHLGEVGLPRGLPPGAIPIPVWSAS